MSEGGKVPEQFLAEISNNSTEEFDILIDGLSSRLNNPDCELILRAAILGILPKNDKGTEWTKTNKGFRDIFKQKSGQSANIIEINDNTIRRYLTYAHDTSQPNLKSYLA